MSAPLERRDAAVAAIGIVGLGHMGSALAANLVQASGLSVVGHDPAGPARAPAGLRFVDDVAEVARAAEVVVLSLPDGSASEVVMSAIGRTEGRRTTHVVDTSTIGVHAARDLDEAARGWGIGYLDAPVSGGVDGARARTLMVMFAGREEDCARVEPILAALSDRRRCVGERPGMAQAMKLANNFLSASALAATSEAIAFGEAVGLDMQTMLAVLQASSGRNTATDDKFPNHVVGERYASGFSNALMAKDLSLYLGSVEELSGPATVGSLTTAIWRRFAEQEPGVDFTRIYPFVKADAKRPERS